MKHSLILLTILAQLTLSYGQETPNEVALTQQNIPQYYIDLQNLSEELRQEYGKHGVRAKQLFGQKRIFECLEVIRKIEKIYAHNPDILNLKGACYLEFRNFDKAHEVFQLALKQTPQNTHVEFNLAEVAFVSKKWADALEKFTTIQQSGRIKKMQHFSELVKFKIMLCQIKTGQLEKAKADQAKITYTDDTPLYYYGNASIAYEMDEKAKAEAWLARAHRVFSKGDTLSAWQDTISEFGYFKSFYGGDLETQSE